MYLRTILIDDGSEHSTHLEKILKFFCYGIEIIAKAKDLTTGFPLIREKKPQLVLININCPKDKSWLTIIKRVDLESPNSILIIFAEHLPKVSDSHSFYSILKPINPDDLVKTVAKARKSLSAPPYEFIKNSNKLSKIILKTAEVTHFVKIKDIIRCEAHGNYTKFYLVNGVSIITSQTLKEYDSMLSKSGFYRVHHSHLINMNCIQKYSNKDGGVLTMLNNHEIPVAQRKRDTFLKWLEHYIAFF